MKRTIKFAEDFNDQRSTNPESKMPAGRRKSSIGTKVKEHHIVSVEIRIIFLKLGNISTKENKYSCEAFMEASWIDRNFSSVENDDQTTSDLRYDEKRHWNPRLYIQNSVGSPTQETWYHVESTSSGTRICERRRIKGEFAHTFNLKCFPLDLQELTICVSTFRSTHEVCLIMNKEKKSSINQSAFTQTHEWTLHEEVCNLEAVKQSDYSSKRHSVLEISVCVRRRPSYYYWNSFLFMFIITCVCFCCFAIRCDISGSRMIVSITVFLTQITFKWALTKNLPSLSYLTMLDKYSLVNIIVIFLHCIYYAVMGVVTSSMCQGQFKLIDNCVFYGYSAIYLLINLVFVLRLACFNSRNNKHLAQRKIEYESQSQAAQRTRFKSMFQTDNPFDFTNEAE